MAKKVIKTAIQIAASPAKVWDILTNFNQYPTWNPFLSSIEGEVKTGNQIRVTAGGMKFQPMVLSYKKNQEISWLGKFLFKGLFDGEHLFKIKDNGDGTITFKHEEKFSGILVGLFSKKLDTETKQGFIQMNEKLKKLSEM